MKSTKKIGELGERVAREFLQRKGFKFAGKNYRTRHGEVDLIMGDGETLVFVEVKAKTGDKYGSPDQMVNDWKLNQVKRMGEIYCQEYEWKGACRVDVVGVVFNYEEEVQEIEHFAGVDSVG